MKPRARRVTIAAAVLGATVVGLAVILNWGAVRDHVVAWHFQLTRETETIEPHPLSKESWLRSTGDWMVSDVMVFDVRDCLHLLSTLSGLCVIVESAPPQALPAITVTSSEGWAILTEVATGARDALQLNGYRVLEQRFPRSAYVVMRDETP